MSKFKERKAWIKFFVLSVLTVILYSYIQGTSNPLPFVIRHSEDSGYTLYTSTHLPQGSLILAEPPLVILKEDDRQNKPEPSIVRRIQDQLDRLPKEKRDAYINLAKSHPKSLNDFYNVHETNSVKLELQDGIASAVFWNLSRINHACRPNSAYSFHPNPPTIKLHALRDLPPGTELSISYVPWNLDFMTRRQTLQKNFAFTCHCSRCSTSAESLHEDDNRLRSITSLRASLEEWVQGKMSSFQAIENIRKMQSLVSQSEIFLGRGILASDAATVAISAGDLEAAQKWASLSAKWYSIENGKDSSTATFAASLIRNPTANNNWATRQREIVGGPLDLPDW